MLVAVLGAEPEQPRLCAQLFVLFFIFTPQNFDNIIILYYYFNCSSYRRWIKQSEGRLLSRSSCWKRGELSSPGIKQNSEAFFSFFQTRSPLFLFTGDVPAAHRRILLQNLVAFRYFWRAKLAAASGSLLRPPVSLPTDFTSTARFL